MPDKGNQEKFSDCQTLKEKANVKQMKISDSKDFYTKDNNLKELLLTADTFRTELSPTVTLILADLYFGHFPQFSPGQQQRYGDCQYLPAPAPHLRDAPAPAPCRHLSRLSSVGRCFHLINIVTV